MATKTKRIRRHPHAKHPLSQLIGARRVLVVDDQPDIRTVVRLMLQQRGVASVTAADGETALQTFREQTDEIGVVLLDVNLPGVGGEEVVTGMHTSNPDVPIVVMTGWSAQETAARFKNHEVAGFLRKPFLPDALVETLFDVLQGAEPPASR